MDDKNKLQGYLIGRFILTLVLIGISELVINLAMKSLIMPNIEKILEIEGLLSDKSVVAALRIFAICLLTVLARSIIGSGELVENIVGGSIFGKVFGNDIQSLLLELNERLENMSNSMFTLKVVLFFILVFAIWIAPFVIGSIVYSHRVALKVNELEQERISREQEYAKQKSLLLSDITHDIKTPITTIAGFSRALADGEVPQDQIHDYQETVYNKSMRVSELVTMLFEYTKLDSKGYELKKERLELTEFVRELVAGEYTEFEDRKLELEADIPEASVWVKADKRQLERAMSNLLSNTLKYSPEGTKVTVSLFTEDRTAVFQISDNGIRIEKEDAIRLFEPFVRGDKTRKSGEGNGLGLSIAKKIVEMHGGKIFLIQYRDENRHEGNVKTFEIRLPIDRLKTNKDEN